MKKYFIFLFIVAAFSGCNTGKSPEVLNLEAMRDSLLEVNSQRDGSINEFIKSLNEIEDNLQTIKDKENLVTVTATETELSENQKDRINNDIQLIYDLMLKNKKKIASLSKKLNNSDIKIAELTKMLERLTKEMEQKDVEINTLKEKLAALNIEIDLLSQNIFNKDYFTKVDIRNFKEIKLNVKKAKIITTHPSSSYKLVGEKSIEKLIISDANSFWGASKYLVILVEQ
ncbi:MAG: hypothetical protein HY738_06095 [Bacteroidia bacterium]|nr:hypothetical protein [Bacteroidia bacterium]